MKRSIAFLLAVASYYVQAYIDTTLTWTITDAPTLYPPAKYTTIASDYSGQYIISAVNSTIFVSNNFGVDWTVYPATSQANAVHWVSFTMDSTGQYVTGAATNDGGLWRSTNFGQSFSNVYLGKSWSSVVCAAMKPQYQYAVMKNVGVFASNNTGDSWFPLLDDDKPYSAVATDAEGVNIYVAQNSGSIIYSNDYGRTWSSSTAPAGNYDFIIASASGGTVAATMTTGVVMVSNNSGLSFTQTLQAGSIQTFTGIAIDYSGQYLAVSESSGGIYLNNKYGDETGWFMSTAPNEEYNHIASNKQGNYLVACANNIVTTYNISSARERDSDEDDDALEIVDKTFIIIGSVVGVILLLFFFKFVFMRRLTAGENNEGSISLTKHGH